MPEIGIRELKAQASEIVRAVREEHAEYVITHRGKPVAMIVPFAEAEQPGSVQSLEEFWAEMDELAQRDGAKQRAARAHWNSCLRSGGVVIQTT